MTTARVNFDDQQCDAPVQGDPFDVTFSFTDADAGVAMNFAGHAFEFLVAAGFGQAPIVTATQAAGDITVNGGEVRVLLPAAVTKALVVGANLVTAYPAYTPLFYALRSTKAGIPNTWSEGRYSVKLTVGQ